MSTQQYTLITGITGELGTALVENLIERKIPAVCIVLKDEKDYDLNLSHFKILKADITDKGSLLKYAQELKGNVHTLIHMASARRDRPENEQYKSIVEGSLYLYDFAKEIGCQKYL